MSSLMVRRPDELLARCAGFLDLPSAGHLAQASRAGQRLVLAWLVAGSQRKRSELRRLRRRQLHLRLHRGSPLPARHSSTRSPTSSWAPRHHSAGLSSTTSL